MRNIAGFALTTSSLFLIVSAILLNSAPLFNMGTATIAMILACRLQAWFAVRGLKVSRLQPVSVFAGETVTMELNVSSDHGYKRPLVSVVDSLPDDLEFEDLSPSLPVAPAHDKPVHTQYQFRPLHRGNYRFSSITVQGSDALGLVRMNRQIKTDPIELHVMPVPLPFDVELPRGAGWGLAESEIGRSKGAGIEPRGIREYTEGDSQRFIHWKSTARAGRLLVKEFETGAYSQSYIFVQRTHLTTGVKQTSKGFDRMCGHAAYLSDMLQRNGSDVLFPAFESGPPQHAGPNRKRQVLLMLADVEATAMNSVEDEVLANLDRVSPGSSIYILVSNPRAEMVGVINKALSRGAAVNLLVYSQYATPVQSERFDLYQRAGATLQFMP